MSISLSEAYTSIELAIEDQGRLIAIEADDHRNLITTSGNLELVKDYLKENSE